MENGQWPPVIFGSGLESIMLTQSMALILFLNSPQVCLISLLLLFSRYGSCLAFILVCFKTAKMLKIIMLSIIDASLEGSLEMRPNSRTHRDKIRSKLTN